MKDPEYIFKVLAEHQLDDRAHLRRRVAALEPAEIDAILDKLDQRYGQSPKPQPVSLARLELEMLRKQVADLRREVFKLGEDSTLKANDDTQQAGDRTPKVPKIRATFAPPIRPPTLAEPQAPEHTDEPEQATDRKMSPLTFTFPTTPPHLLPSIAKYALIADAVYLDDPFYDALATLAMYQHLRTNRDSLADGDLVGGTAWSTDDLMSMYILGAGGRRAHESAIENVANYVDHLLSMRDLITTGRVILFKDIHTPFYNADLQKFVISRLLKDKSLTRFFGLPHWNQWAAFRKSIMARLYPGRDPSELLRSVLKPEQFAAYVSLNPTIVSLWTFGIYNPRGMSTDLLSPELAHLHRLLITEITNWNRAQPENERIMLPVASSHGAPKVLLIDDIPLERVIDAYLMEQQAFDYYRQALNEKLLSISSPPGTLEREKEIAHIKQGISREMTAVEMASRAIQKQFMARFSIGIALSVAGVVVTGLGTGVAESTPWAVAGSAAGASAIVAGARELIKELLDHQKENAAIRQNPNYFVWRARSLKDSKRLNG